MTLRKFCVCSAPTMSFLPPWIGEVNVHSREAAIREARQGQSNVLSIDSAALSVPFALEIMEVEEARRRGARLVTVDGAHPRERAI